MIAMTPETRAELDRMQRDLDALGSRISTVEQLAITVQRAATTTSLRESDIRAAIHNGALPALRVGRRLLILTPDLRVWLEGLKQAQAAEGAR